MIDRQPGLEAAFLVRLGNFALDIGFDVPMRGVTALFGPSGCGKTTVLRCIAGLQRAAGRLVVGGEIWQDDDRGVYRAPHERPIGYVFQEASLFPHLSVRGNLDFGHRRALRKGARELLKPGEVTELLGLGHLLDRATTALSGGERQRVAVGRALLAQPRLLLMDEPLSALDHMTRDDIIPYFEALHENLSIPILYVSHDIAEVVRLADRMVIMSAGEKVAQGPVSDVLERLDLQPETGRFEAGVVVTARVVGHDLSYRVTRLDHHGQTITVPLANFEVGEWVRLRVRARDVALATRRPEATSVRNILAGTITEVVQEPETAFAETLVDIGGARLRARITREAVADLDLVVGKAVFALVKSVALDRRSLSHAGPHGADQARPKLS